MFLLNKFKTFKAENGIIISRNELKKPESEILNNIIWRKLQEIRFYQKVTTIRTEFEYRW